MHASTHTTLRIHMCAVHTTCTRNTHAEIHTILYATLYFLKVRSTKEEASVLKKIKKKTDDAFIIMFITDKN